MKIWQVAREWSIDAMELVERPEPEPGPGQVVVRMRAASLNYRDLLTVQGQGGAYKLPLIPFSDGAGEVAAVGQGVSRVSVGDRVCPMFFQSWFDGGPSAGGRRLGLGGTRPGVLQELLLLDAEGVSRIPDHLTFAEAATLPCAALTAWRALFEEAHLRPGQTILVQGTGGVSIFALQFAKLAGATVIVTSSSDEKLELIKGLGAAHVVNYKSNPEWGPFVGRELGGVDKVVEVGGAGTAEQSMAALRTQGEVALIGVLQPEGGPNPRGLMMTAGTMRGIFVGSAAMARRLNAAINANGIQPLIGARFGFEQAKEAYAHAWGPDSFAKTVIELV